MKRNIANYVALSGLLLSLGGCNTMESSGNTMAVDKSLYERLGGKPAITAVVDDFVGRVSPTVASTASLRTPIFRD